MESQIMDRSSDVCQAHLAKCDFLEIRQSRRGYIQECFGCEARTELRYFLKNKTEIANSLEESDCCCRLCCSSIHPFRMRVNETKSQAELFTVERPVACSAAGCKCCCYQKAKFTSDGVPLGMVKETFYCCVPTFKLLDASGRPLYKIHPPSCCGGCCLNCFTEGNPCCGKGCCKVPFWVFPADQRNTNGNHARPIGKILKKPKSLKTEIFTDANAFEVNFPSNATVDQKAMLVGTAIFLNAVFFEDAGS